MKRRATLNRAYRLVWNQISSAWVTVAENAKGCGKPVSVRKLVAAALALMAPLAYAAPGGGQITAGSGAIAQTGVSTTITQQSQHLAIDWQSFGIAANEAVRFNQPNAASIALNRVLGQDPSQIFGSLGANGQVFILNPNGILFGSTAQVNVGGLVASTLGLSNADFIAGNNTFTNPSPASGAGVSIVNQGTLTANSSPDKGRPGGVGGYIALLAPEVRNEGAITATLGTALLAAGDKVTLNLNNGSLLSYTIDQGALNALAENKQLIRADGGQVYMTAKAADALSTSVVNHTGIIEARTVQNIGGTILLVGDEVRVSGTLDASGRDAGGTGGTVKVLGDRVGLFDGANIDASGDAGGGTVLIGGNFQGKGPEQNAAATFVAQNAQINADALTNGDGGRVILWADGTTRAFGSISARGGAQRGDGGFVEVSGKQHLIFAANVDRLAPNGSAGTLLLDPTNLTIAAGSASVNVTPASPFEPATASGSTLGWSEIDSALLGGAVSVQTTTGFDAGEAGNITITGAGTLTNGNILSIIAAGNIIQNSGATITRSAAGALNLTAASGSVTLNDNVTLNGSALTVAAGSFSQAAGTINAGGLATIDVTGASSQAAGAVIAGAGGLTKAGAGTLTLSGGNTYTGVTAVNAGTLSVATIGNGGVAGNLGAAAVAAANLVLGGGTLQYTGATASTNRAFTLTAATTSSIDVTTNNLTISGVGANTTGALTKIGAGTLTLSGANLYTGLTTVNAGTLAEGVNNALSSGAVTVNGGTFDINTRTNTVGAVTLASGNITGTNGVLTGTSYTVESGTIGAIFGGAGALTKNTAGTVILSGANTYTGATTVSAGVLQLGAANVIPDGAGKGNVSVTGMLDLNGFSETINGLSGAGTVDNTAAATTPTLTVGNNNATSTFSGVIQNTAGTVALTKAGTGTLTLSGVNTYTGATTINAGVLSTNLLADGGATSGIGASSNAAANLVLNGGTLYYTGGAVSTDRLFSVGTSGGTMDTSGSGTLIFSNTGSMGFNAQTGTRTLTLTGSNAGSLAAVIGDNSGATSLTKTGTGTWTLAGTSANTYTGTTTINAGTLLLNKSADVIAVPGNLTLDGTVATTIVRWGADNQVASTSAWTIGVAAGLGGTVDLNSFSNTAGSISFNRLAGTVQTGAGTLTLGGDISTTALLTGNATITGNLSLGAATRTITNNDAASLVIINAAISGAAGAGLTKAGAGQLQLGGANTYSGATTINGGELSISADNNLGAAPGVATANQLNFNNGTLITTADFTLNANRGVSLTNTGTFDVGTGTTLAYGGIIAGTGGLTKVGTGTLTLSGANTYNGATAVSAGVVRVQNAAALGDTATGTTVTSGEVLEIDGADMSIAEPLSITGTGVSNGGAVRNLANSNTLTGGITLTGTSRINSDGGTLTISTNNITGVSQNLTVGGVGNTTISAVIGTTTGTLTMDGIGTLTLSGANTYTGLTTVNAGTLAYGISNALSSGGITVDGGTLDIGTFSDTVGAVTLTSGDITGSTGVLTGTSYAMQSGTVGAILGGTGALTKTTTGTVTLSGANTYTGVTAVNAGVLRVQHNTALGTLAGGTTVTSGEALELLGGITVGAEALSITGTGVGGTGALLNVSGDNTWGGTVTLTGNATIGSSSGLLTLNAANAVTGNFGLTFTGAGNGLIGGTITTGANTLTKTGTGTWTLAGTAANTYTGTTTVGIAGTANSGGTLLLGKSADVIAVPGDLTVIGTGTVRLLADNQIAGTSAWSVGTSTGATDTTGTVDLNNFSNTVGSISFDGLAGTVQSGTGTLTLGGDILTTALLTGDATITGNLSLGTATRTITNNETTAPVVIINAAISGEAGAGLTKAGAGQLQLGGASTYTGATTINAGTLSIAADTGLGTAPGVATAGQLTFGGGTLQTTATFSLAANRGIALSGAGTISTDPGTTLTYGGIIAGASTLTKAGTGTLSLSGASTYTGVTTVSAGVLRVQHDTALGTPAGGTTVTSGEALELLGGITVGAEALSITGTGVGTGALLNVSGDNTWGGTVTLTGNATIGSSSGLLTLNAANAVTGAFDLTFAGAGNGLIGGTITTGANTLTKAGSGTLALSGANTYTGLTTVSAGTLAYGISNALSSGGITVDGGTLDIGTFSDTVGAVTLTSGDITGSTGVLTGTSYAMQSGTVGAILGGTGALTKTTTGTVTLSGANTYTGDTNIDAGTLRIVGGSAIADTSAVVLANVAGAIFDLNGTSETVGSLAGGGVTGGNVTLGAGTLTAGGDNSTTTFTGVLSGTGGLTKVGTNTLTLSGANTYTGTATVSAGTLALGASNVLADASRVVVNGGTLSLTSRSDTVAGVQLVSGSITGTTGVLTSTSDYDLQSGSVSADLGGTTGLIKSGAGTLTLSGANTFTGGLAIKSGTVSGTTSANAFGASSSVITLGDTSGSANATLNGGFAGTFANPITVASGSSGNTLSISNSAASIFSGAVTLNNNLTLAPTLTSLLTLSGGMTGTGNLIINGSGTTAAVTLSTNSVNNTGTITNSGTNTGTTTISGGVGANVTAITENSTTSALTISGALTVNGGGTALTNTAGTKILTVSGGVGGTGNLVLNNNSALASGITLSTTSVNNTGTITNSGTGSGSTAISAVIGTNITGVVENSATSQLTLSGANTFTTGLAIKSGTVSGTTSANAFGASTITIGDSSGSANATLSGGLAGTFANPISVASGNTGIATITGTAASIFSGAVTLNTHDLSLSPAASNLTLSGGVTGTGNLTLNATGAGVITLSTASANNTGTITNSGAGGATNVISAVIGTNVTDVVENSTTSQLNLSGVNTYTGATTISNGTLNANASAALGDGSAANTLIFTGGTLQAGGTIISPSTRTVTLTGTGIIDTSGNSVSIAGVMSGPGGLTKAGTGTLTLSGVNTYTGATTINAGTLSIAADTGLGTAPGVDTAGQLTFGGGTLQTTATFSLAANRGIALSGAGTISTDPGTTLTYGGIIAGAGGLTKTGTGTWTLAGTAANTYTGTTTVGIAGTANSGGTLLLNKPADVIAVPGDLTVIGTGTVRLLADNQIAGTSAWSVGTSTGTNTAGTVDLNNFSNTAGSISFDGLAGTVQTGAGMLTLGGDISTTTLLTGNANITGNLSMGAATRTVTNNDTASLVIIDAPISGAPGAGLTKAGAGQLQLGGASTYSGATTISAGDVLLLAANSLSPNSALSITSAVNPALLLNNFSQTISSLSGSGNISLGTATLTVGDSTSTAYSGVMSGTGAVTKAGSGTLTLSGANTYTGDTTISAGTLTLGAAERISNSSAVSIGSGATLDLNGLSETVGSISGAGGIVGGTAGNVLTAGGDNSSTTYSGVMSGTGTGLSKTGTGTLTLSGANTCTGTTTVSAGVLSLAGSNNSSGATTVSGGTLILGTGSNSGLASGTLTISTATVQSSDSTSRTISNPLVFGGNPTFGGTGNLNFTSTAASALGATRTVTVSNTNTAIAAAFSGAGFGITKAGAGTFTLSGDNTYTGVTRINAGVLSVATIGDGGVAGNLGAASNLAANLVLGGSTLQYTGATASTNRNFTLIAGTTSSFDVTANNLTLAGASTATTGALTKLGAGTLTLSGANLYTGLTTMSAGTLAYGITNAMSSGGVTVNGGTLDIGIFSDTVGAVTLVSGDITGSTGVLTGTSYAMQSGTVGAILGGTAALTKTTAGTVILSGANTYTGATAINAGTLALGAINAVGSSSAVTVAGGATFDLNGFSDTIGSLAGAGMVTSGAAGAVALTAGGNGTTTTFSGIIQDGSSTVALTKAGTGMLTLSGVNTYTGATTINAGTLSIAADTGLGTAPGVDTAGQLTFGGGTLQTTATFSLAASRGIALSGAGTISTDPGTTLTYGGIIAGASTLTKAGTGTLSLSGASTYTGVTTISAGTLVAANAAALGSTAGNTLVANAATLEIANVAIGSEAVTLNGTGIGGAGALTGTGTASLSGPVTLATASALGAAAGNALALSGAIEGSGALDVLGGGTVTLGGTAGSGAALASFSGAAGTALVINGGLVRTAGAQTYSGATTFGGATALRTTTGGNVSAPGAVTATAGTLTLDTGAGDATLANTGNDFGTVAASSGNNLSLVDANSLSLAGINATGLIDVRTQTGDLTLNNAIATTSTSANAVTLIAGAASTPDATGSGGNFKNTGNVAIATGGAWRIYTGNPTGTARGALAEAGKRYNVDDGSDPLSSGNRIYFRIQPTLTLTTANMTKVYGDANPAFTSSYSGLIDGDLIGAAISSEPTYSFDGSTSTSGQLTAGTHNITPGAATSSLGYFLSYANGTLTVNQKALTIAATGVNREYDGTKGATVSYGDDRVAGDALSIGGTASYLDKNVGTGKTVNVTGIGVTGTDAGNYAFNTTAATSADIIARALAVTAAGINKIYDGLADATVSYGDDRVAGDMLSIAGSAVFADKNVGTGKTVNVTGIGVTGADAGNYTFNATAATSADIIAKALSLSGLTANNKVYDGATTASISSYGSLAGIVGGEAVTLDSGGASSAFADKNVGAGKTVTVSSLALAGPDNANYSIADQATTADITARALTVTAAGVNKVYDGLVAATVIYGDDRVAGDALSIAGSAVFADKNVGTGKTVNVTGIGVTGTDAGNYAFNTTAATSADITARALTVTAAGVNKVYDGLVAATVSYGDDRVAGEVLSIGGSAVFADKNAGTGKTVNVTGIGVSGTDAGNYTWNTTASTAADIIARDLTVAANAAAITYTGVAYFGGNGVTYTGFVNGETSAALSGTLAYSGTSQGATNPGSYVITPSGLTSDNYAIAYLDGVLTVNSGIPTQAVAELAGGANLIPVYAAAIVAAIAPVNMAVVPSGASSSLTPVPTPTVQTDSSAVATGQVTLVNGGVNMSPDLMSPDEGKNGSDPDKRDP